MLFVNLFTSLFNYAVWAAIIEFIGGLVIIGYIVAAIATLLRGGTIAHARLLVADGALAGLNFKVAGTLLKTIELHTWQQILMFVAIFALRIVLKRAFAWERIRVQRYDRRDAGHSYRKGSTVPYNMQR